MWPVERVYLLPAPGHTFILGEKMTVAQVRLLIPDNTAPYVFTDQEIEGYLDLANDNAFRAAALAIKANAAILAQNYVTVKTDDLTVSAHDTVDALMKHAKELLEQADAADSADFFQIIPNGEYCHPEYAEWMTCARA
jgi:hypothetical protein